MYVCVSLCSHPPLLSSLVVFALLLGRSISLPVLLTSSLIIELVPTHSFIHSQPDATYQTVFDQKVLNKLVKIMRVFVWTMKPHGCYILVTTVKTDPFFTLTQSLFC